MPITDDKGQKKFLDSDGLSSILIKLKTYIQDSIQTESDETQVKLNSKLNKPNEAGYEGQVLKVGQDGNPTWATQQSPSDSQVRVAVYSYLESHPTIPAEVEDGSVTQAKLSTDLQQKIGNIATLSTNVTNLQTKADELDDDLTAAEESITTLQSKVSTLETGAQAFNSDISDIQDDIAGIQEIIPNYSTTAQMTAAIENYLESDIADRFDPEKVYLEGDYAVHDGKLVVAKETLSPGEWNAENWEEIKIVDLIELLSTDIQNISTAVQNHVSILPEQGLTSEEKTAARANIDAASTADVTAIQGSVQTLQQDLEAFEDEVSGLIEQGVGQSIRYDQAQTLTDEQKTQARANAGAASSAEVATVRSAVGDIQTQISQMGDRVTEVEAVEGGIQVTYGNGDTSNIPIEAGSELNSVSYDENYYLHFYDKNGDELYDGPFFIQGGGGGGGTSGGMATITRITETPLDCVYQMPALIRFTFTATDSSGDAAGNGVGTWSIGGMTVARNIPIVQGENSFDISPYLNAGENNVRLSVSVDTGGDTETIARKTWTVNAVNMRFNWTYNDSQINETDFLDSWTVYGDIAKTTHTSIDGEEIDTITTSRSNVTQSIRIPMLTHGAHQVERWITATIGEDDQSTEHQFHEMIFVEEGDMTPIIAISMKNISMNQYDTIRIPVVVYNPASLLADATLSVDGQPAGEWSKIDRSLRYWNYTPSTAGTHTLTITCGEVSRSISVEVESINLDVEEVAGYSFRFKSSEFATNEAVRNWTSNGINATFSNNFNWINGGLQTETDASGNLQQYLCIKAGDSMTINHKLFANDPKANGMTFKIIFKVRNCRNYDAQIGHCFSNVGLQMYAHNAVFSSSGMSVNVPYGEDEYIELEFDVYPAPRQENDGNVRYMMAWIDGVITTCRVYGETDNFVQPVATQEGIVLGSEDCDLYLYMVKAYPMLDKANNFDNHISNFIMDAPNAAEMAARYSRNNILDESGDIDYTKLMTQNPDCRVWLWDMPYMTIDKDDKVKNCTFNQFWTNGDRYYQMSGTGTVKVQGTSSVKYVKGAANTDMSFKTLEDGYGNDLLANAVVNEDLYGNNYFLADAENPEQVRVFTAEEARTYAKIGAADPLGPEWVVIERDENRNPTKYIMAMGMKLNDDSCPITYSNTKVNFASCEQVNNMCNAVWYQRYNPYPSLTARDCMEFNMGVQFIKDSGDVPDDNHFVLWGDNKYHMYSIANMGTSKKNVHLFHDLSNPKEVCIEVNDNDKDQMRMITDDLSEEDWSGKKFFGMRYPDTKNPSQEVRDAWQRLVTWMATSNPNAHTDEQLAAPETYDVYTFKGHDRPGTQVLRGTVVTQYAGTYTHDTFERRMAKMLSECEDYMVMDSFVYHFVYLERHTMVDNVSKNNFWSSTDLLHWDLSKAYDMDTSDGNNNQGQLVFDYGLEFDDVNPTDLKTVFNGSDSVWFVFVGNLYEACRTMFTNREAAGAWSASAYHNFLLSEQRKVPERCWVQCYWYDYLRTYEQKISTEWMSFLDGGQKTHQRNHYETYEELYDSSKYRGIASVSQNVNLRAYTPSQWGGVVVGSGQIRAKASNTSALVTTVPEGEVVYITKKTNNTWREVTYGNYTGYMLLSNISALEPKGELTVTMYNKMYISVDVGTTALPPVKAERGVPYVISFDQGGLTSNTVISINTAPMIQAISGLEQLYPDTCVFSAAVRLRELTLGSAAKGYVNTNLRSLALDNNVMLERLYVQNQPNANSVLNLSNCPSLVYLDATGSGFTGYEFADGGLLETAIVSAPVSLNLRNLANLTPGNFRIEDYSKLSSLWLENTPGVDSLDLVTQAINLQVARIIGIDWTLSSDAILNNILDLQGYDENGITIAQSVLAGDAFVPNVRIRTLNLYNTAWPDLDVTYNSIVEQYAVHFVDDEGNPIPDKQGEDYVQYIDRGQMAYDPIEAEEINTPVKEADAQYTYTFSGWTNLDGIVLADKTVTAQFASTVRTYTVRWFAQPGVMLKSKEVTYGAEALYDDDETVFPTKTDEEGALYYNVFSGWDKSTGFVTQDIDVYAVWERAPLPNPGELELNEMNVAQISGVAKSFNVNNYWDIEDYVDIPLGRDFNFSNVTSEVLATDLVLTKTNLVDTGKKLFAADAPSFTLAIDYEFLDETTEGTLVACYGASGAEGFRLCYRNGAPTLVWGDKSITVGNYGMKRGMLVLLHIKGSNNLFVASNNNLNYDNLLYADNLFTTEVVRTTSTQTDATLVFGGTGRVNGNIIYPAAGIINWCKVWYGHLGVTAIKQLANWPHETIRMKYVGTNRVYPSDGSGYAVGASFVSNSPLSGQRNMEPNSPGWDGTNTYTFLNDRVYKALPYGWQQIIKSVNLPVLKFNDNNTQNQALVPTKVYMPAYMEIDPDATNWISGAFSYEGSTFAYITRETARRSRLWFAGITIPEDAEYYSTNADPSSSSVLYNVKEGDVWIHTGSQNRGYIYVSAATAAKHMYFGYQRKDAADNIQAADGGLWVSASHVWTRTHYQAGNSPYYYSATPMGTTNFIYSTDYLTTLIMFSV